MIASYFVLETINNSYPTSNPSDFLQVLCMCHQVFAEGTHRIVVILMPHVHLTIFNVVFEEWSIG